MNEFRGRTPTRRLVHARDAQEGEGVVRAVHPRKGFQLGLLKVILIDCRTTSAVRVRLHTANWGPPAHNSHMLHPYIPLCLYAR